MKRFLFTLETLLIHRTNIEEKERTVLSRINFNLQTENQLRESLKRKTEEAILELSRKRSENADREEIGCYYPYLDRLRYEADQCEKRIVQLQGELEAQKARVMEASRNRKLIDTLKKRRKGEYLDACDREQQKEIDELVVSRFALKDHTSNAD
jgi:flagellar FliJ protein